MFLSRHNVFNQNSLAFLFSLITEKYYFWESRKKQHTENDSRVRVAIEIGGAFYGPCVLLLLIESDQQEKRNDDAKRGRGRQCNGVISSDVEAADRFAWTNAPLAVPHTTPSAQTLRETRTTLPRQIQHSTKSRSRSYATWIPIPRQI